MDDLTSNIPALHHGLHRLSEHDLHGIPDGAGEGRAKVDVKPECDRVVADITSKARRRPVVCSSTTDWVSGGGEGVVSIVVIHCTTH